MINRDMGEVYLTGAIRTFAISMVGLFIPIYLYQLGYGLVSILWFFVWLSLFSAMSAYIAAKTAVRYGAKYNILLSIPILILTLFMFYSIGDYGWLLWFSAMLLGVSNGFYWTSYHAEFAKFSDGHNRSREVGMHFFFGLSLAVVGPVVGGLIIQYYSFQILFMVVSVLLLMSPIPILYSRNFSEKLDIERVSFKGERRHREIAAFAGEAVRGGATKMLWPLFIFIIGISFVELGGLFAIADLLVAVLVLYVGKLCVEHRKEFILKTGSFAHSFTVMFRGFLSTVAVAAGVSLLGAMTFAFLEVPYASIMYNKANRQGIFSFVALREIVLHIVRCIYMLFLILVYSVTTSLHITFIVAFVAGGAGALAYSLFRDD